MKSSKLVEDKKIEDNIIKDVKNLFRLKKPKQETCDTAIRDIRNLFRLKKENEVIQDRVLLDIRNLFEHEDIRNRFRLKKENKVIKHRIIRDIRNLFEHKEGENYYKPVRVSNFWSNDYIEYKSNCDRSKTQPVDKYLN